MKLFSFEGKMRVANRAPGAAVHQGHQPRVFHHTGTLILHSQPKRAHRKHKGHSIKHEMVFLE